MAQVSDELFLLKTKTKIQMFQIECQQINLTFQILLRKNYHSIKWTEITDN